MHALQVNRPPQQHAEAKQYQHQQSTSAPGGKLDYQVRGNIHGSWLVR